MANFIRVRAEEDRLPSAIEYVNDIIEELHYKINGCDYVEDVNGNMEYQYGAYSDDKQEYVAELEKWEKMLSLLTTKTPFTEVKW